MTTRDRPDACPGAVQTHLAADGRLARVRVPGGLLDAGQVAVLAGCAAELADGALELTSRGNLQLRGLAEDAPAELARRLFGAGLLPSEAHETARNVVASVLSGRSGGLLDVRPLVRAFDAGLVADPSLAELPGRFLVTVDDGRGDVHGLGGDVGLVAVSPDAVALALAGTDTGLRATAADAHQLALAAARAFLAERAAQGSRAWRLTELTDGPRRLTDRVVRDERGPAGCPGERRDAPVPPGGRPSAAVWSGGRPGARPPLPGGAAAPLLGTGPAAGAVGQTSGLVALVGLVPLGRLTTAALDVLVQVTGALGSEIQVTPWRSVVVPDLPDEYVDDVATALHHAGLVFDAASPWAQVTACAGLPGCAKSRADVRGDAARAVATGTLPVEGPQHWAGCERRCGRPAGSTDVLALGDGYRIGAG